MNKKFLYLKVWDGYITDGRDAGYPEVKFAVFTNLTDLAKHREQKNEVIFGLEEMPTDKIKLSMKNRKNQLKINEANAERLRDEKEFERLRKKLGK